MWLASESGCRLRRGDNGASGRWARGRSVTPNLIEVNLKSTDTIGYRSTANAAD
jgi:hypothetical protein